LNVADKGIHHFQMIIDITGACNTIGVACMDSPDNITICKKS